MKKHFKSPKATVVGVVYRNKNNVKEILLTKRNIEPFKNKWCLPGGHIDPEETALDAVKREIKEETGLNFLAKFHSYFDEVIPEKNIHAVVIVFSGTSTGELNPCEEEVNEVKWLSLDDALSYDLAFLHDQIILEFKNMNNQEAIFQELSYLRNEILNRFDIRNKMLNYTMLLAVGLLAFGKPEGFIVFPILGTVLAGLWSHSDYRIYEIGKYIKKNIEPKIDGLDWENEMFRVYSRDNTNSYYQEKYVLRVFTYTYWIMFILAVFYTAYKLINSIMDEGIIVDDVFNMGVVVVGAVILYFSLKETKRLIRRRRKGMYFKKPKEKN